MAWRPRVLSDAPSSRTTPSSCSSTSTTTVRLHRVALRRGGLRPGRQEVPALQRQQGADEPRLRAMFPRDETDVNRRSSPRCPRTPTRTTTSSPARAAATSSARPSTPKTRTGTSDGCACGCFAEQTRRRRRQGPAQVLPRRSLGDWSPSLREQDPIAALRAQEGIRDPELLTLPLRPDGCLTVDLLPRCSSGHGRRPGGHPE